MFEKDLDKISEKELQELINKVTEGKKIEYKLMLPLNHDKDKQEFLADVTSFANASGGYILYMGWTKIKDLLAI